jgi:hypothetical protein
MAMARRCTPTGSCFPTFISSPSGRALRGRAVDAEDPGHDHVEGDLLHPRRERERPGDRPAVDLALGDLADHLDVALDRLAVEGRQEQFALTQVARPVRGQHRGRSDDRP